MDGRIIHDMFHILFYNFSRGRPYEEAAAKSGGRERGGKQVERLRGALAEF